MKVGVSSFKIVSFLHALTVMNTVYFSFVPAIQLIYFFNIILSWHFLTQNFIMTYSIYWEGKPKSLNNIWVVPFSRWFQYSWRNQRLLQNVRRGLTKPSGWWAKGRWWSRVWKETRCKTIFNPIVFSNIETNVSSLFSTHCVSSIQESNLFLGHTACMKTAVDYETYDLF